MRIVIAALILAFGAATAVAQDKKDPAEAAKNNGSTLAPVDKGQMQPQGHTGPLTTSTGGAPAESPQGQSPPGMQAAPHGSDKKINDTEPKK